MPRAGPLQPGSVTARDDRHTTVMTPSEDATWDAGDLGCGELVLELRRRLRAMPGGTLKLVATDPGAPADIPAWCGLTHHALLHAEPPAYWIRARTPP